MSTVAPVVVYGDAVKQQRRHVFEGRINLMVGQLASLHDLLRSFEVWPNPSDEREEWLRYSESSLQQLAKNLTYLFRSKDDAA